RPTAVCGDTALLLLRRARAARRRWGAGRRQSRHLGDLAHQREPRRGHRVAQIHPEALDYLDTYDRAGLLGRRTVLAHNVHPQDRELARMAEVGAVAAHCPTSNSALASGFFPL